MKDEPKVDKRAGLEQIGNLFYAIAVDQQLKLLQVPQLQQIISRTWIPKNSRTEEFMVSDATHYILSAIDENIASRRSSDEAFDQFVSFYNRHSTMFTQEVKEVIWKTAGDITNIFHAGSQGAAARLASLKKVLNF